VAAANRSVGLALRFTGKKHHLVVLFLCAIPAIVLLVPIIYTAFVALGLSEVAFAHTSGNTPVGLLIPHFAFASSATRWLPVAALVIAVVCLAAAAFNSGFSRQYPKSDHVFYVQNADTGKRLGER
jgi:ABC-type glycerol-3-phosphate transport system permease component